MTNSCTLFVVEKIRIYLNTEKRFHMYEEKNRNRKKEGGRGGSFTGIFNIILYMTNICFNMAMAREKLLRHGGSSKMFFVPRFPEDGKLMSMYYLERKEVCHG